MIITSITTLIEGDNSVENIYVAHHHLLDFARLFRFRVRQCARPVSHTQTHGGLSLDLWLCEKYRGCCEFAIGTRSAADSGAFPDSVQEYRRFQSWHSAFLRCVYTVVVGVVQNAEA